jgi:hypothetical protein
MKLECYVCEKEIQTKKTRDQLIEELREQNPGQFLDSENIVLVCNDCHQLQELRWMPVKGTA